MVCEKRQKNVYYRLLVTPETHPECSTDSPHNHTKEAIIMSKVKLRPITVADVDDLLAIAGNPDVAKYIPDIIQDKETFTLWISTLPSSDHEYMVIEKATGMTIGECSIDTSGEIGLMEL